MTLDGARWFAYHTICHDATTHHIMALLQWHCKEAKPQPCWTGDASRVHHDCRFHAMIVVFFVRVPLSYSVICQLSDATDTIRPSANVSARLQGCVLICCLTCLRCPPLPRGMIRNRAQMLLLLLLLLQARGQRCLKPWPVVFDPFFASWCN